MSAPFIIPFNHQPVSSIRRAGAYTIPAGRYARFTPIKFDVAVEYPLNSNNVTHIVGLLIDGLYVPCGRVSITARMGVNNQLQRDNYVEFAASGSMLHCTMSVSNGAVSGQISYEAVAGTGTHVISVSAAASAVTTTSFSSLPEIRRLNFRLNASVQTGTSTWTFSGDTPVVPLWLAPGTVITQSALGTAQYMIEEYSVIS